jgi:hypothetical protein
VTLTQRVSTSGMPLRFASRAQASFLDVAANTPNPCIEFAQSGCIVRVCNLEGAGSGVFRRAGVVTLEGSLTADPLDAGPDGGADDGGVEPADGGVLTLWPTDAGASVVVNTRLFTAGLPLVVSASGDEVPAFISPSLPAPSQLVVTSPRCEGTCAPLSRAAPIRVEWTNAPVGDVSVQLVGRQVSARCLASGLDERFEMEPEVLREFPPTVEPGDTTLIVSGTSARSFDAGGWAVTFSASTPTFIPLVLE